MPEFLPLQWVEIFSLKALTEMIRTIISIIIKLSVFHFRVLFLAPLLEFARLKMTSVKKMFVSTHVVT